MTDALRLGTVAATLLLTSVLRAQAPSRGPHFYPDDPLSAEPPPLPVAGLQHRALSAVLETVNSNLKSAGQRHRRTG